jgi:hypothetical protein
MVAVTGPDPTKCEQIARTEMLPVELDLVRGWEKRERDGMSVAKGMQ